MKLGGSSTTQKKMNERNYIRSISIVVVILVFSGYTAVAKDGTGTLPNIVYILADDMGYGDVSALNPESMIQTPNIDRLASEGMNFTDAHSGSSVCTPTRYGILTGRYCWRTRLKRAVLWNYDNSLMEPNGK